MRTDGRTDKTKLISHFAICRTRLKAGKACTNQIVTLSGWLKCRYVRRLGFFGDVRTHLWQAVLVFCLVTKMTQHHPQEGVWRTIFRVGLVSTLLTYEGVVFVMRRASSMGVCHVWWWTPLCQHRVSCPWWKTREGKRQLIIHSHNVRKGTEYIVSL
jgi:hypothetical protein